MAKYRVELVRSMEGLEHEAPTVKRLYDIVRSDFRFTMNHTECDGCHIPYEEADFYKWDDRLEMWTFIGAMFLNITPYRRAINLGVDCSCITLYERVN